MSNPIQILINGHPFDCAPGIPLSSVLSQLFTSWRHSPGLHQPRGMYCGMGACFECIVHVNGILHRSCLTQTVEGMQITIERDIGDG